MRRLILLWLLFSFANVLWSQNDSSVNALTKTLQNAAQEAYDDSLQRSLLEAQIKEIHLYNSEEKKQLMAQLNAIKQKQELNEKKKQETLLKLKSNNKGAPVAILKDTVFIIHTRIGSFSSEDRANAIAKKLKTIYEQAYFYPDSFLVSEGESTYDISYNNEVIMSVSDLDELYNGTTKQLLAISYKNSMVNALLKLRDENSLRNNLIRAGEVILVLVILILLMSLLNKLAGKISDWVNHNKSKFLKPILVRNYELIGSDRMLGTTLKAIQVMKWLLYIIVIYIALPIVFSFFPYTQNWANLLINWILSPIKNMLQSIINYLPNLFSILVIYLTIKYLVKLLSFFAKEIETGKLRLNGFEPDLAQPSFNIIKFLLYAFMFVLIFPYLPGSDSPVFQGVSVFLGILFSMGSSSTVGNIIAGLVITYMKPFMMGDRIKVGDVVGDVVDKSLLVTRIRTIKNEDITIPNSNLLSGHVINFSSSSKSLGLIIHTTVTIGYDVPWKDMHSALIDAALSTTYILSEPKPFVLQTSLDDFYVSYQINAYTAEANKQAVIYSSLHQNIQDKCNERGIEILSPHYRAQRDGNQTTIPANYLPEDYTAPAFKIENKNK